MKKQFLFLPMIFFFASMLLVSSESLAGYEILPYTSYQKISGAIADEGIEMSDNFGYSLANIGDLDENGVTDLAIGVPEDNDGSVADGAVWIFFFDDNGAISSRTKILADEITGTRRGDRFAESVAAAGDIDGDGIGDLLVGTPGTRSGAYAVGSVWVLFLNHDGTLKNYREIKYDNIGTELPASLWNGSDFGLAVAGIGDLDGDGVPDIAVGAGKKFKPLLNGTFSGSYSGAIWIFFMNANGSVKNYRYINNDVIGLPPHIYTPEYPGLGASIAAVGDMDGDGVTEIATGIPGDSAMDSVSGAVLILFMNGNGTLKGYEKFNDISTDDGVSDHYDGDSFGRSVAGIGDINDDGIPDIAVGADGDGWWNGHHVGAVWILTMTDGGTPSSYAKLHNLFDYELGVDGNMNMSTSDQYRVGRSLASMGTFNTDGTPVIAIGEYNDTGTYSNYRPVWMPYLAADGSMSYLHKLDENYYRNIPVLSAGAAFGSSVSNTGDLNNDGTNDLIIGAGRQMFSTAIRGAAYLTMMDYNNEAKYCKTLRTTQGSTESGFGSAVAGLGDVNGDGFRDVSVGIPLDDYTRTIYGDSVTTEDVGSVDMLSLNENNFASDYGSIGPSTTAYRLDPGDDFGYSVANIGDLNGDGYDDIAVGAPGDDTGYNDTGAVWIFFLAEHGWVMLSAPDFGLGASCASDYGFTPTTDLCLNKIDNNRMGYTLITNSRFGSSVTGVGDINGDGIPDIAVGAPSVEDGTSEGELWVLFMDIDGTPKGHVRTRGNQIDTGVNAGDLFGHAVASAGDINGDGIIDLAVGAPNYTDPSTGTVSGGVWTILLRREGTTSLYRKMDIPAGSMDDGDKYGWSITNLGGNVFDHFTELAIGAPGDDDGAEDAGAVYVMMNSGENLDDAAGSGGFSGNYSLDFGRGRHVRTYYNATANALMLASGNLTGYYESPVIDAGASARWDTFDWQSIMPYGTELPQDGSTDTLNDMNGNKLLMHFNRDTSVGENNSFFHDYSGTRNNGSCSSDRCPSYDTVDAKFGDASLNLDGADDEVIINHFTPPRKGTVSMWIKPKTGAGDDRPFGMSDSFEVRLLDSGRSYYIPTNQFFASGRDVLRGTKELAFNKWHLLTFTYNADTHNSSIYVDGKLDASGATADDDAPSDAELCIGCSRGWSEDHFLGNMDEVAVWDRVLSPSEISRLYMRGAMDVTVWVRSCNNPTCSDAEYVRLVNNSLRETGLSSGRYFQIKFEFERNDISFRPAILSADLHYTDSSVCEDGTLTGKCSTTKPAYCRDGWLIDDCTTCGCTTNSACFVETESVCRESAPMPFTQLKNGTETANYDYRTGTLSNVAPDTDANALKLNGSAEKGSYTSQVFDASSSSTWNKIKWSAPLLYDSELPDNKGRDADISMTGSTLLLHFNENFLPSEVNKTFADSSGSRHNGTCANKTCPSIVTTDKKLGRASLNFNGIDNEVIVGSFTPPATGTVSMWINISGDKERVRIMGMGDSYELVLIKSGSGYITSNQLFAGGTDVVNGSIVMTPNKWHYLVYTYNTVSKSMSIYVDGQLDATGIKSDDYFSLAGNLCIGGRCGRTDEFFSGMMDEFSVWNRELSAEEIRTVFERQTSKINFEVRSCSNEYCQDGSFKKISGTGMSSMSISDNRYFQYRCNFESDVPAYSPILNNVTIEYTRH